MTDIQMIGIFILKLWWLIIPFIGVAIYNHILTKEESDNE